MLNFKIKDYLLFNRGDFQIMDYNSPGISVYHKLHDGILRLLRDYTNDLKHEETHEDRLCKHLMVLMKWSRLNIDF